MLGLDPALGRGRASSATLPALAAERRARRESTCPRRRSAATCRSGPTGASPTTTASAATAGPSTDARRRRRPLRGRVPRVRERPRRRGPRVDAPRRARPASSSTTRRGRRACPATSGPAGTSTTCATTTWRCCSASTRGAPARRPRPLPRALARRHAARSWPRSSASGGAPARRAAAGSSCGCATSSPGPAGACVDHRGAPKAAYHHLRRALAPAAVWLTDEGLGGIVAHVANDGPEPLARAPACRALSRPRAAGRRRRGGRRGSSRARLHERGVEDLRRPLRRTSSWAYRFGPPAQDVVVASLERGDGAATTAARPRRSASRPGDRSQRRVRRSAGPVGRCAAVRRRRRAHDRSQPAARLRRAGPRPRLHARRRRLLRRAGRLARGRPPGRWRRPRPSAARSARSTWPAASRSSTADRRMTRRPPARPLYLDLPSGPVFAVYHAPSADAAPATAVLLCPPWGWNDVTSYRARRAWAEHLADGGHPTLRFDFPGTGDSAGVPADPAGSRPGPGDRGRRGMAPRSRPAAGVSRPSGLASAAWSRSRRSARARRSTSSSRGTRPATAARSSGPSGPSPACRRRATA